MSIKYDRNQGAFFKSMYFKTSIQTQSDLDWT